MKQIEEIKHLRHRKSRGNGFSFDVLEPVGEIEVVRKLNELILAVNNLNDNRQK